MKQDCITRGHQCYRYQITLLRGFVSCHSKQNQVLRILSYISITYFYISQQLREDSNVALHTGKPVAAMHPGMLPYLKLNQKNPSSTSGAAASPFQSGIHRAEVFWGAPMPRQSREAVGGQDCGAGSDSPPN